MKRCNKCHRDLPLTAFHKLRSAKDGVQKKCKACQKEIGSKRYAANKELFNERTRAWKKANPEKSASYSRKVRLRRQFNMTEQDWQELFARQEGRCAICGVESGDSGRCRGKNLVVDHDHSTGRIRGLLCVVCNLGLGHFQDDLDLMEKAIQYVKV